MAETLISSKCVCDIIAKNMIINDMEEEIIVRSKEEYKTIFKQMENKYGCFEKTIGELCYEMSEKKMIVPGYCNVCGEQGEFELDYMFSNITGGYEKKIPAYRERLVCTNCGLNNRMRYLVGVMKKIYSSGQKVYMYEYITQSYHQIHKFVPDLIGSEYLGEYKSGTYIDGILHEDAMSLSFNDDTFDIVLSQDVFEHVSDYKKAFSEMYRVMKVNGKAIITVPFAPWNNEIENRAELIDGKLIYHMEPIYHGNPLSNEGVLVFNIFSWDLFDSLKKAGFNDAYAVAYHSVSKANYGILPFYIIAEK